MILILSECPFPFFHLAAGVSSSKSRCKNPRYGAIPVPVPTMITSASGVSSGRSIIFPLGPVRVTSCPAPAVHKKLEHTPCAKKPPQGKKRKKRKKRG